MLDAPCGAVVWTTLLLEDLMADIPCFRYTGVDVVASVVERDRVSLRHLAPRAQFHVSDVSRAIPGGAHDLILSRDALQHLPWRTVVDVLEQYCATHSTFLLVGSYPRGDDEFQVRHGARDERRGSMCLPQDAPGLLSAHSNVHASQRFNGDRAARVHGNVDIALGQCSTIDLVKAPFNLPAPLEIFDEKFDGKHLYLYHLPTLCAGSFIADLRARVTEAAAKETPPTGPNGCYSKTLPS